MSNHFPVAKTTTGSADEFESVIEPIAGTVRLTPKNNNRFRACINVSKLGRVGIALLDFAPMHSRIEPQHNFYCLTVPLVNSCFIKDVNTRREFSRNTAHLLYPGRALDSQHRDNCQLIGATFMISTQMSSRTNITSTKEISVPTSRPRTEPRPSIAATKIASIGPTV